MFKKCFLLRYSGIWLIIFLAGCGGVDQRLPTRQPTAVAPLQLTLPPTPPITPHAAAQAVLPTPLMSTTASSPPAITIGATAAVPPELIAQAQQLNQPPFRWSADPAQADVLLDAGRGAAIATWTYAVAAPFATLSDNISLADVQQTWQTGTGLAGPLLLTPEATAVWATVWGQPASLPITVPAAELVTALWKQRPLGQSLAGQPLAITLLPIHQLQPELKLLSLNGLYPLAPSATAAGYPLQVEFGAVGEATAVGQFLEAWGPATANFNPQQLTSVAMTGVTALVRATAFQMELNGIDYPGTDVAPILAQADIAHVSNEVAFSPDCPYPDPIGGTTFCSHERYFALLQQIGVDVVELTGNHVNDWGAENLLHTLDLYDKAGMVTFGGGRNAQAAAQPALFEHHGNRIAFVGCNPVGPAYAWATELQPGSRPCSHEMASDEMAAQIAGLREAGYLVLATLQYQEYYHYAATLEQQADFRALAAAGATAVSGSQGHHAQGFSFDNGAFIHYGLGNLFFDQMDMLGTRQTFVDTYYIYNGRLLTVALWTGLIENYAHPRPMTADERRQALQALFQASGWY